MSTAKWISAHVRPSANSADRSGSESATFSIVERSVDGKRIRQTSADDLDALSRAFQVPIGFWITPSWTDEGHPRVVTPDVPEGLQSQTLLDALMGNDSGWGLWASELLNWAARQAFRRHPITGDLEPDVETTDDLHGLVDNLTKLRSHTTLVRQFGDLLSAKEGLQRVLAVLDTLMFDPETESAPTDNHPKGRHRTMTNTDAATKPRQRGNAKPEREASW